MKKTLLFFILVTAFSFSCKKPATSGSGKEIKPTTEENEEPVMVSFTSIKKETLLKIDKNAVSQELPSDNKTTYFGADFEVITPDQIKLLPDSIVLYKANIEMAKFKIKKEDEQIWVYQPKIDDYINIGKLKNKTDFTLNLSYSILESHTEYRTLSSRNKDYFTKDYRELITKNSGYDQMIWLHLQATYK